MQKAIVSHGKTKVGKMVTRRVPLRPLFESRFIKVEPKQVPFH
jgi:hypothetical protein